MIPLSTFSYTGVDVGSSSRNMAYLYGLSDFFSYVFEDTETLNLMLEANALRASEIYSKFLQLTSSLTLAGVQENIGSGIELLLITEEDQVDILPKFRINKPINSAKFLSNRPFLPDNVLEEGVDFKIVQENLETCILQFAKPINDESYGFSKRILSSGVTQYAIWASDVSIDEQLMYKHYGKLLGIEPEVSSEQFSNFIYGLFYLYQNGPTLSLLEQGLNLVLGIPIPREEDTVLDIRIENETGQYVVITNTKKYVLPTGTSPEVGIGDTIGPLKPIAKWIELKDFISDDTWWLNVSIPPEIIRVKPKSQEDRVARPGNRYYQLMQDYLFRNTFLIRINVGTFKETNYFSYLPDIISKAKPAHTQPIFIWRINMGEDEFGVIEELNFTILEIISLLKSINSHPINQMVINE